jgi:hypothetical protein
MYTVVWTGSQTVLSLTSSFPDVSSLTVLSLEYHTVGLPTELSDRLHNISPNNWTVLNRNTTCIIPRTALPPHNMPQICLFQYCIVCHSICHGKQWQVVEELQKGNDSVIFSPLFYSWIKAVCPRPKRVSFLLKCPMHILRQNHDLSAADFYQLLDKFYCLKDRKLSL